MFYRLKEIREAKGLSRLDLATLTGIPVQDIIRIEDNHNSCTTTKTLVTIANSLGVNVADIFF